MIALMYVLAVVLANVVTASFPPLTFGFLIIPCGSFFIGATFVLRDFAQKRFGRKRTYYFIAIALILSWMVSFLMGDTLMVAYASALSFLVAETTDTEIYTRLKLPMKLKVLYSGIVGGFLDSVIFVIIALSPIGMGVLTWNLVGWAILGQVLIKVIMQFIGVLVLRKFLKD